jgi:hypothetical protein
MSSNKRGINNVIQPNANTQNRSKANKKRQQTAKNAATLRVLKQLRPELFKN